MSNSEPESMDSWPGTVIASGVDSADSPRTQQLRRPGRGRATALSQSGAERNGTHHSIEVPGYEILEEVGRGGMGVVFKARQVSLDRIVALKVIRDIFCATGDDWSRFLAEAEAVAALHHPGIVQIHECGQAGSIPFMALEFVEGGSLAEEVADRLLPPREAAAIVQQIARAVQHAHSRGTIHRDLKPENVLLTAEGRPLVSDFGLARRLQDVQQKTLTGTVLGTPGYMAPEQAAGRTHDIGVATDVYGLGAILYRLLTGRPPFQAADYHVVLMQVLCETPVRPRQLDVGIPADLETICLKCLRSDPAQRYASAAEVAEDLERWLAGQPIMARPVGRVERAYKWVRRNRVISALIALVILLMVAGTTASSIFAVLAHQSEQRALEAAELAEERAQAEADAHHKAAGAYHQTVKQRQMIDHAWRSGERRYKRVLADWNHARQELLHSQRLLLGGTDRLTRNQLDRQWRKHADADETYPALYYLDQLIAKDSDRRSYLLDRRVNLLRNAQRKNNGDALLTLALAQQAFLTPELIGDRAELLGRMVQAAQVLHTSAGYRWLGALQLDAGSLEKAKRSLEMALQLRRLDAAPREECLLALVEARQGKPEKARKVVPLARQWLDRFAEHARKQRSADSPPTEEGDPLVEVEMNALLARLRRVEEEKP